MNAKGEFINHIGVRKVLCAQIQNGEYYSDDDMPGIFSLTTGWDSEDWTKFLSDIDFEAMNLVEEKSPESKVKKPSTRRTTK